MVKRISYISIIWFLTVIQCKERSLTSEVSQGNPTNYIETLQSLNEEFRVKLGCVKVVLAHLGPWSEEQYKMIISSFERIQRLVDDGTIGRLSSISHIYLTFKDSELPIRDLSVVYLNPKMSTDDMRAYLKKIDEDRRNQQPVTAEEIKKVNQEYDQLTAKLSKRLGACITAPLYVQINERIKVLKLMDKLTAGGKKFAYDRKLKLEEIRIEGVKSIDGGKVVWTEQVLDKIDIMVYKDVTEQQLNRFLK